MFPLQNRKQIIAVFLWNVDSSDVIYKHGSILIYKAYIHFISHSELHYFSEVPVKVVWVNISGAQGLVLFVFVKPQRATRHFKTGLADMPLTLMLLVLQTEVFMLHSLGTVCKIYKCFEP